METTDLTSPAYLITCLLLTNLFIHWFSRISQSAGLVDQPNQRKIHQRSVPLIGGISIICSLSMATFVSPIVQETIQFFLLPFSAVLIIFGMSICDDKFDISAKLRLAIQIGAALLVAYSGVRIESMFGLFGMYGIPIELQYLLTLVVLVGSTNAFNLIDGVDGLAGSLGLITSILLAFIALNLGLHGISVLCLGLAAGLIAFLKHNLYPAKIFMGDAGSMTLGFLLTLLCIILLQTARSSPNSAFIFILIACALMVPVIDALRVFIKRYSKGNSILTADKSHLHHLILGGKQNHKKVVARIVVLQLSLLLVGVLLTTVMSITGVLFSLIFAQILLSKVLLINKTLIEWQQQLRNNEKAYLM